MNFAAVLLAECNRQGLSFLELGNRCGMSGARISEMLQGKVENPGIRTVHRVLKALGKDLLWLAKSMKESEKAKEEEK